MGEIALLKNIIQKGHISFFDEFNDWPSAVRASYGPLLLDGTVDDVYVETVISSIREMGPYIVIGPDVAIPHTSMDARGVHKTDIAFMRVKKPVAFTPGNSENDARIFFSLAAVNPEEHLENMSQLAELLMMEGFMENLPKCNSKEDLEALGKLYHLI